MSRLNSHRLIAVMVTIFIGWGQADARPARVDQIPNGRVVGCAACHVNPAGGGAHTPFGRDVNKNYLVPSGRTGVVQWNAMLAMLDSDGDGVTNGQELGDPDGDGIPVSDGDGVLQNRITNPGDPSDFIVITPPNEPGAIALSIGGMSLETETKNPSVPSGRQVFEVVFPTPLGIHADSVKAFVRDGFYAFPSGLIDSIATAPDLAVSADGLKLTATIDLPEGATYQMFIGASEKDLSLDSPPYYFGTVELPDAVVSGEAIVPDPLKDLSVNTPGVAMLLDLDILNMDAAQPNSDAGGSMDGDLNRGIVRIVPLSIAESDPPRLFFNLKYVPDGAYGLYVAQEVGPEGRETALSAFVEIAVVNGEMPPASRLTLSEGGVLEPQMPREIAEVRVQSVDAANHRFAIQNDDGQMDVSVVSPQDDIFGTLFVHLDAAQISDIIFLFLAGDLAFVTELFFPFADLMPGDTVSILGLPGSDGLTALMVIRHAQVAIHADFNADGAVDFADFLVFVEAFGTSVGEVKYNASADLNDNDMVDFADFLIFANAFGKPVGG